ncbi:mucin TcMUCII [Trypanosoma cruzi]|nr:mucin TcMUCII [Trypanosoma cruzi]
MTCRLLCALLVLALCCCSSVCVTATGETSPKNATGGSVTGENAESGEKAVDQSIAGAGEKASAQPSGDGSAGRLAHGSEGRGSGRSEEDKGKAEKLDRQGGAPPSPPAPAPPTPTGPINSPNSAEPGEPATSGVATEPQSAQQLQSQLPAAGNQGVTGDGSPESGTAAASDATRSTTAGGDAEPTSPSPGGQAAASGPGENSAAEGTPNGTPPSAAAVTHDDNTSTTDTATSEGNSTAAGMPAPLSSAPTTKALESSIGNDAFFHDTRLHAPLLLALAALAYAALG